MIFITRRESFNAAHRMFRQEWSDAKNYEVFGKCSNPNWHGHNYFLFVTVKGEVNAQTGCVLNLHDLGVIIRKEVIDQLDHKNINLEVDFMKDVIPSSENLAIFIWKQLEPHITPMGAALHKIRIEETENNFVEYFGS